MSEHDCNYCSSCDSCPGCVADEAKKLEHELGTLRAELAEAKRESSALFRAMAPAGTEELESVAGVVTQINNMVAGLRAELGETKARLADARALSSGLAQRIDTLKRERDEHADARWTLESELAATRKDLLQVRNELHTARDAGLVWMRLAETAKADLRVRETPGRAGR